MKRHTIIILLTVFITLGLMTACGSNSKKTRNEKEILADICANDSYLLAYDYDSTSIEIEKRLTDEEKRLDDVWVYVTAENEDCNLNGYYLVSYAMYNEGWYLEDVETLDRKISVFSTADQSIADELVAYENATQTVLKSVGTYTSETQYEENKTVFNYEITTLENNLSHKIHNVTVTAYFTPDNGWNNTSVSDIPTMFCPDGPNLLGEWRNTEDSPIIGYVDIKSIDVNKMTMIVSYKYVDNTYDDESYEGNSEECRINADSLSFGETCKRSYYVHLNNYGIIYFGLNRKDEWELTLSFTRFVDMEKVNEQ